MGWNHRVIRTEESGEICYAIHECYYDRKGDTIPTSWTAAPAVVMSETRGGLLAVLAQMADGIRQPVLEARDGKLIEVEPERQFIDDMTKALKAVHDEFGEPEAPAITSQPRGSEAE